MVKIDKRSQFILFVLNCDTGIVWSNPNISDMKNKGMMDVYIFIFSAYIE